MPDSLLEIEGGVAAETAAGIGGLYRSLVDNALQGLVLLRDGRIVFANQRGAALSGYTPAALRAMSRADLAQRLHVDDRALVAESAAALRRGERVEPYEIRVARKDGAQRWFEVFPATIVVDGAAMTQVAFLDVTDRRRALDALRDREERLRLMFDEAKDALFVHTLASDGESTRIVEVNDMACRQLGTTREELLSMSMTDVTSLDQQPTHDDVERLKAGGDLLYETELLAKDWRRIPVEVSARTFTYRGARMVLLIARDVTERKAAQAALNEKDEVLLQAQKLDAVGRLAGGVAHDFNNLLGIITGSCGILELQLDEGSELREDIAEITKAAERAAQLTRKLLAFSRKQVLEPVVLDINDAIGDTHRMLKRLIGEDIELITLLAADPGYVKVDRGSLEQVIINLAVNARDAMPSGGKLVIETVNLELHEGLAASEMGLPPGPYVVATVTDTGSGIDPEILPKVFEPFFTTKERGKGTGLGLSTVYGILKQSRGAIAVDSTWGKGTSFRIYLPECNSEEADAASRRLTGPPVGGTERVLLAEDEEGLRQVLAKVLERAGYEIIQAHDGADALRKFELRAPVDILVTDMVMPTLGGVELAAELRRRRPQMPVLFMSGHIERVTPADMMSMGACAFLLKPVSVKRLTRAVRSLLDGRPPSSK